MQVPEEKIRLRLQRLLKARKSRLKADTARLKEQSKDFGPDSVPDRFCIMFLLITQFFVYDFDILMYDCYL